MSTILDALRRAQGSAPAPEGDAGPEFPPQTPDPDGSGGNGRPRWAAPLIIVVGLVVGVGAARLMVDDPDPPPAEQAVADVVAAIPESKPNVRERVSRRERATKPADALPREPEAELGKPAPPPIATAGARGDSVEERELPATADAGARDEEARGRRPQLPAGIQAPPRGASADAIAAAQVDGDVAVPPSSPPDRAPTGRPVMATPSPAAPVAAEPPVPAAPPEPLSPTPPEPLSPTPPVAALDPRPDDAAELSLLFVQWSRAPERRVATIRSEAGSIVILREGDLYQGMRVARIRPAGIEFHFRTKRFLIAATRN